ncbi:MAG: protein tyrosine phosphatase family protein [Acidobacteriota bacterium]|nr:protein tyrosine phosphatase family protein [Acidobacteriota bacterium]
MNLSSKTLRTVLAPLMIFLGLSFVALAALSSSMQAAPLQAAAVADTTEAAPAAAPEIGLLNARQPMEGLLTGGQITQEQMKAAAAAGYRTIINLRGPGEAGTWDEAALAEQLGLEYIEIPIASAADLTEDNARRLAKALEETEGEPTVVHCGSGNRVGALLALKAYHVDGKSAEEALEIGAEGGMTRLRGTVEEYLATHEP